MKTVKDYNLPRNSLKQKQKQHKKYQDKIPNVKPSVNKKPLLISQSINQFRLILSIFLFCLAKQWHIEIQDNGMNWR